MAHKDVDSALLTPCPSVSTKLVLVALAHHRNWRTGRCHPSMACLERETGLHRVTVQKAVKALIDAELLEIVGRGKRGLYFYRFRNLVVRPPEFAEEGEKNEQENSSLRLAVSDCQSQTASLTHYQMQSEALQMQSEATQPAASGCTNRKEQEKEVEIEPSRSRVHKDNSSNGRGDEIRVRVNRILRREESLPFSSSEAHEAMNVLEIEDRHWDALEAYYKEPKPTKSFDEDPGNLLLRRKQSALNLLLDISNQISLAHKWAAECQDSPSPASKTNLFNDPPSADWENYVSGLVEEWRLEEGLEWEDCPQDIREAIWRRFGIEKKDKGPDAA